MGGDIRSIARASDGASASSDRFANSLTGLQRRLSQFQRTGNLARYEMDHMRRSMGLLGRDLRRAAADGELTEEQFGDLRHELERTRLEFDHLDNALRRQDAMAQRTARRRAERQREAERLRREEQRAAAQAQREADRQAREEAQRNRRAASQAAALLRQQESELRQRVGRLASVGSDGGLNVRFRGLEDADLNRMARAFSTIARTVNGVSASSAVGRRNVAALGRDLQAMAQVLQNARREGNLTRREFDALANGLSGVSAGARGLRRSGDMSRAAFRGLRREVALLQRDLAQLGDGHRRFGLLGRAARAVVAPLRRLGGLFAALGRSVMRGNNGAMIFVGTLLLLGPVAQALGALLTTVLGGAFVALGAFALRGNAQIKSAFQDLKATVGGVVRESAAVLAGPLVSAMNQVGAAVRGMQPELASAFAATAPLVDDFIGAFTDLARAALPGIVETLKSLGPVMDGFRTAMALVGKGIGEMFSAMTADGGAQALKHLWITIGFELRNLLVGIGEFVNFAAKSESATILLVGAFRLLSGVLNTVEGYLTGLDAALWSFYGVTEGILELFLKLFGVDVSVDIFDSVFGSGAAERAKRTLSDLGAVQDDAASSAREHGASIQGLISKFHELNDTARTTADAQSAMEKAIDDAVEGAKKLGKEDFKNGMFNLDTEKGRIAYDLASRITETTGQLVKHLEETHAPAEKINEAWKRGREQLIGLHDEFNLTKEQMTQFADQFLNIPDPKLMLKVEKEQAVVDLAAFNAKVRESPGAKSVKLKTLSGAAERVLEAFGLKVERLPDGQVKVSTKDKKALSYIISVAGALNNLDGSVANTYVKHNIHYAYTAGKRPDGATFMGASGRLASGGRVRGYAGGGDIQHFPNGGYVDGPGSGTSDSILATFASGAMARVSDTEYVVRSQAVKRYGVAFLDAVNQGRLKVAGLAKGGKVKSAAKGAKDEIRAATSGDTEKRLLKLMDTIAKGHMKMSTALKAVSKELTKAKDKLRDLKSSAASLANSVKSGVLSAANITSGVSDDKPVTMQSIMSGLTQSRDKATAFADALKRLRKRGLNNQMLQQIAEAGIEGGGLETAGALLQASDSELKTVNSLQSQISKAATSAGKTTADALYAKSIKAQENLVKALDRLADELKKATKKAKKKATGGIIGAASGGLRGGLVEVGEQGPELVRLPYGSSVYSNPDSRRILGGGGGSGGGSLVIPIYIGGKQWDEVVVDTVRRTVRARGGNVQAAFGR